MEAKTYYTDRIDKLNVILKSVRKRYHLLSLLRLFFFLLAGNTVIFLWGSVIAVPLALVFLGIFLYMVNLSVNAKYQRDKLQILVEINENELLVLKGDWSMFADGKEFRDGKHPFSQDMDLFGKKSVFQLLNRTVSIPGRNRLAETLENGSEKVNVNKACITELSENMDWCQEFMAEGLVRRRENDQEASLASLSKLEITLDRSFRVLQFLLPALAISSTVLLIFGILPSAVFGVVFLLVMLVIGKNAKKTNAIAGVLEAEAGRVKTILEQLKLYSELVVKDPVLKQEQATLLNEKTGVLKEMVELNKIMNRFDYRINLLVGVILNFFAAWDFLILHQLKKWLDKNAENLMEWEKKMAELEVWISGAVFKFNRPEANFAKMNETVKEIEIKGLSHPFVDKRKSIRNDVSLKEEENFIIITGPNMAGKSTYLRSLGLTFVLANAGFPVLADSCTLPELKLFSSMRTSDDLTEESSYFHAELIRLRFIMDAIEAGEKVFIILDEILKGTNSKDKEAGSAKFLQKLKSLNSKGIIATHDLSLCELAKNDTAFRNMCFDSTIEGDSLSFDYKVNEGVCKNMNASFLLKQMNLVD